MPPERPITTSAKPFLRTKSRVPSTSASHTSAISGSRGATPTGSTARVAGADAVAGRAVDDAATRRWPVPRDLDVDDHQALGELGGPGDDRAVGGHDHRVAVEDELVLPADLVDVGDGGTGLGGPVAHDGERASALPTLYGEALRFTTRLGTARPRAAIGPSAVHASSQIETPTVTPATDTRVSPCRRG